MSWNSFWKGVGGTISAITDPMDIFGTRSSASAQENAANVAKKQASFAQQELKRQDEAAKAAKDWLNTGGTSGELAARGSAEAGSQAAGQARSLGMNAAQAAQIGSQAGGNRYSDIYGNIYGIGANTLSGLSGQAANAGAGLYGAAGQTSGNVAQNASAQSGATIGAAGGIIGGLLSDERKKKLIKNPKDVLDAVFEHVQPKQFNYKDDSGEDPNIQHIGIMAQDLEKTPLSGAVMNTPEGKKIDAGQLTLGNTAMLSELNEKLNKALEYFNKQSKQPEKKYAPHWKEMNDKYHEESEIHSAPSGSELIASEDGRKNESGLKSYKPNWSEQNKGKL